MPADPSSYYSRRWPPPRLHPERRRAAARLARAAGQRPPLPRDLAARRPAAARCSRSASRARQRCQRAGPAARVRQGRAPSRSRPTSARPLPNRLPGTPGAAGAARWFRDQLALVRAHASGTRPFARDDPGPRPRRARRTCSPSKAGRSPKTIVVMAHRDDTGAGPGANDNASGTAALVELARAYAPAGRAARVPPAVQARLPLDRRRRLRRARRRVVRRARTRGPDVIAVVNLDAIAGPRPPRLELDGRHAAFARARPRRDRRARGSPPRPAREPARAEHAPAARRPRLPVQPLRAGAVRRRAASRRSRSRPRATGRRSGARRTSRAAATRTASGRSGARRRT